MFIGEFDILYTLDVVRVVLRMLSAAVYGEMTLLTQSDHLVMGTWYFSCSLSG